MITTFQMYILVMLNDIKSWLDNLVAPFLTTGILLFIIGGIFFIIVKAEDQDSLMKPSKIMMWLGTVALAISLLFYSGSKLVPTTKQMCAIIVVPKIINAAAESETLKKIPAQVLTLTSEWLEELRPSKEDIQKAVNMVKKTPDELAKVKKKVTDAAESKIGSEVKKQTEDVKKIVKDQVTTGAESLKTEILKSK